MKDDWQEIVTKETKIQNTQIKGIIVTIKGRYKASTKWWLSAYQGRKINNSSNEGSNLQSTNYAVDALTNGIKEAHTILLIAAEKN